MLWFKFFQQQYNNVNYDIRTSISHILNIIFVISTAFMLWEVYAYCMNTESPAVVVLTGSMEPGIRRGDILHIYNNLKVPIVVGDMVVFKIEDRFIPIIHRIIEVRVDKYGNGLYLTKVSMS